MPQIRRKFDLEFREGAVRIVRETGKPVAVVARDLGIALQNLTLQIEAAPPDLWQH